MIKHGSFPVKNDPWQKKESSLKSNGLCIIQLISPRKFMDDSFKVYVEQLRDGQEQKIHEVYSPEFLEVSDNDLSFEKDVRLDGIAYTADDELVLNWEVRAHALLPCRICNEKVSVEIHLKNFYHCEPTSDIKTGIFNFKELLRETILLEVPPFAECNEGDCPQRKEVSKYLKQEEEKTDEGDYYHPFADLDLK